MDESRRHKRAMARMQGKDLIAKLMLSHTAAIDQKASFSLAKYKLLKTKKYMNGSRCCRWT